MEFTLVSFFVGVLFVLTAVVVGMWADNAGHLDPIKATIAAYLAKAKAKAAVAGGQKQLQEQGATVVGEGKEKTATAQDAVGSVGDGLGVGEGEGGLKRRL